MSRRSTENASIELTFLIPSIHRALRYDNFETQGVNFYRPNRARTKLMPQASSVIDRFLLLLLLFSDSTF